MAEFLAKSGAKVVINIAPWVDAKALKKAIQREIAASGLKIDLDGELNLGSKTELSKIVSSSLVSNLMSAVVKTDGSDSVDDALFKCLCRCTRNGEKIVNETFDNAEARGDYYEIAFACIKENLGPLAESLFSRLLPFLGAIFKKSETNSPTSK
jgi:Phage tail assembly chaperone protein, TAC